MYCGVSAKRRLPTKNEFLEIPHRLHRLEGFFLGTSGTKLIYNFEIKILNSEFRIYRSYLFFSFRVMFLFFPFFTV
jgi:hypothetical protein